MFALLQRFIVAVGKFLLGVFAKQTATVTPSQPGQNAPYQPPPPSIPEPPLPPPLPIPVPPPALPTHGPQSPWWDGRFPITQGYGCTDFPTEGHNPNHPECLWFHEGIDIGLPCNTDLYAAIRIGIIEVDPPGYYGGAIHMRDLVHLDENDHYKWDIWMYHLNRFNVAPGQVLEVGERIGWSGDRGLATGCHLHFEVRPNGGQYRSSIDPTDFLYLR